ncbi:DUF3027 domain-containing protein [Actinomyces bowdenii]|uniref:DUF3027 domain-containing protein n=1 Tax=Actinomyces bowdenii TaxID=131109 RepID=UPI001FD07B08|nr:DUF3027 domain-containing protein [Actinomyces bowdenii]
MSDTATQPVPRLGALPSAQGLALAAKDKTLTSPAAVELARAALEEVPADGVGEHLAATLDEPRLVTHLFACTMPGYRGWHWAVTLSRPPRGRTATVCEMGLLPGDEALLAPAWVPWAERLEPGDLGRSDRLPRREHDERLEPGWEATGQDADAVALDELDLGRARVLSAEGVSRAAQRWYAGDHGPQAEGVRAAHATCSTCGFFLPMAGAMRAVFGVCANEWAADDGSVVSLDHGCGAHSETDVPDQGPQWPITPSRVDDHRVEAISTGEPRPPRGASPQEGRSGRADDVAPAAETPEAHEAHEASSDDPAPEGPADAAGAGAEGPAAEPTAAEAPGEGAADGAGGARIEPLLQLATAAQPHEGEQPAAEPRPVQDPGPAPAEAPEQRAASAREAVADLAGAPRPAGGTTGAGPMTLADLEASLPQR